MFFDVFPAYASQTSVALPEYEGFWNSANYVNPVYSGVRFGSDGKIYRSTPFGAWQWTGMTWLLDGAASGYYLKWDVISGSAFASAATDLSQMNANLDFYITTAGNRKTTDVTFGIASDAPGTTIVVERTYRLDCERPIGITQGDEDGRPTWRRTVAVN